jgi:hypothetical protein
MSDDRKEPAMPDSLDALLPWHATRRLDEASAQRVGDALTRDPELARRLTLVEEERAETVALNEALGAPSNRARDRLFERIQAEGVRRAPARARFDWLSGLVAGFSPRALAFSTAILAAVAILQAGVLAGLFLSDAGGRFTTASGPEVAAEGSYVLLGFAPQASAAEIEAFLASHRATIVDGPRPGGLFRVRISERRLPPADLDRVVSAMRSQPQIVRLVAPSL